MGHSRPRAIPELGRGVLPRRRLLCARLRRDLADLVQEPGELARRVPHPGVAARPRELPVRCHRQQGGHGRESHGHHQEGDAVVPGEEQRAVLRDERQGGHQCGAGLSDHSQERVGARERAGHVPGRARAHRPRQPERQAEAVVVLVLIDDAAVSFLWQLLLLFLFFLLFHNPTHTHTLTTNTRDIYIN